MSLLCLHGRRDVGALDICSTRVEEVVFRRYRFFFFPERGKVARTNGVRRLIRENLNCSVLRWRIQRDHGRRPKKKGSTRGSFT